jgi:hypothetical protein
LRADDLLARKVEIAVSNHSKTVTAALSAKGLCCIPLNNHESDFTFYVDEREYVCPSFIAEFFSPRVCNLRRNDSTIQDFHITTTNCEDSFESFLSLGFGSSVCISSESLLTVKSLGIELQNLELYQLFSCSNEYDLTAATIIDRLIDLESFDCVSDREIAVAASHFFELSISSISRLSVSILSRILSHESLQLTNEDSLYELISSSISNDSHYCVLLDYVGYEYLSKSSILSFFDLISNSFHFLTVSIWTRLRSRLVDGISECTSPRIPERHFPFRDGSPFEGIISYLTKKCGGNVSDCEIVSVTSSSVHDNRGAKNVADLTGLSYTHTLNIVNS